MNYDELKKIATPHIRNGENLPSNAFLLLCQLHIQFKTKSQCDEDFDYQMTPLYNAPAFLKIDSDGNKTIYFNDKTKYWNFYIFHEIAHYLLGHESNSLQNELDADMLACILAAPPENLPSYLKSARDLGTLCQIPIDKAEMYWQEINNSFKKTNRGKATNPVVIFIFVIIMLILALIISDTYTSHPYTDPVSSQNKEIGAYYITTEGTHYHVEWCQYIRGKNNVEKISIEDTCFLGLEPCSVCIGQYK